MTEPEQKAERRTRRSTIVLARAARVSIAYKTVPGNTADFYALQVLANVSAVAVVSAVGGGGSSSRLNQKLVREKELVTECQQHRPGDARRGRLSMSPLLHGPA